MDEYEAASRELEALIAHLDGRGGLRFWSYDRAALERRIRRRMGAVGVSGLVAYRAYLDAHADELERLSSTVPVKRTGFFRDPTHWAQLARLLPELVGSRHENARLRVWSAGCSTGEEAYSLAMLFSEVGGPAFLDSVEITATDVSPAALETATAGVYRLAGTRCLPPAFRERYFKRAGEDLSVTSVLRRAVCFRRHDLLIDPPLLEVDLIVCRNTLVYLTGEARTRVVRMMHAALRREGVLFSGPADGLTAYKSLFARIGPSHQLFRPRSDDAPADGAARSNVR